MDQDWDVEDWKPSDPTMVLGQGKPSAREVEEYKPAIINATQKIKETPYLFLPWIERSFNLGQLGYPELAAADAYKAILLCNAALDDVEEPLGDIVRFSTAMHLILVQKKLSIDTDKLYLCLAVHKVIELMRGKAYLMLSSIVLELRALPDVMRICIDGMLLYPIDSELSTAESGILKRLYKRFLQTQAEFNERAKQYARNRWPFEVQKKMLSFGSFSVRTYPWTPIDKKVRSQKQIEDCNQMLRIWSNCLEIRPSTIGGPETRASDPICYGMFATRDISQREIIMTESHAFAMSLEQPKTQCMNCFTPIASAKRLLRVECCPDVAYCSDSCFVLAYRNYHDAMCGKDFTAIIDRAHESYGGKAECAEYGYGTTELGYLTGWDDHVTDEHTHSMWNFPDLTPVFMIRLLAICIQAGCDPLSHPNMAQLKPNDQGEELIWSFNGMVKGPIEVLQKFGIDVFANQDFDTWLVLSMWYRFSNNCTSSITTLGFPNRAMAPSYCWFNHSCSPNAVAVLPRSGRHSDSEIVALRNIEEGEEVFVSYMIPDELLLVKEERHKHLSSWLNGACNCSRCRTE